MNIPDDVMKRVYTRGYEEAFAAYPLGDRGVWITGGVRAVAEWARREALREARNAIASLGYVIDSDVTGFPSGQAIDRAQALAAIRALAEGEQG